MCFGTAPLSQPDAAAACISATPPARFRLLTTTRCSRSGSSTFSVGESSKPVPAAAGVHDGMSAPCGMYMKPMRIGRAASVFANTVAAGTIASSSGKASTAPAPRRKLRLGTANFDMNMALAFVGSWSVRLQADIHGRLKPAATTSGDFTRI